MPRAGLFALLLLACGGLPAGVLETELRTTSESLQSRALAGADDLAALTAAPSLENPAPGLVITGPAGPLTDSLRAALIEKGHGARGTVELSLTLPDLTNTSGLAIPVTIKLVATWPAPPQIVRAEATITGTLDYRHGGPADAVPVDLGRRLAELVDKELIKLAPPPTTLPPLTPATQIAVAQDLACTLHEDHVVRCWGAAPPQIGAIATPIPDLLAREIDAGDDRVCARLQDNTVRCLGRDLDKPTPVCDVADATAIAVGARAACALVTAGEVRCWPMDGAFDHPCGGVPSLAIPGVRGATAIAAGFTAEAALLADASVTTWTTCETPRCEAPKPVPTPVPELADTVHLSVDFQPCGLDRAGTLRCAARPELGTFAGATEVMLASHRGCVLLGDRSARCWRTGLASEEDGLAAITDYGRLRDLDLGIAAACLVDDLGAPWCWTSFADHVIPTRERVGFPRRVAMPW